MVNYDPRNWLGVLTQIRGSVMPRLVVRVLCIAAIGFLATYLFEQKLFKLAPVAHTMVGAALGLLLASLPIPATTAIGRDASCLGARSTDPAI